ncbi:Crp/Fnr family transcriptional regulator [Muricauda sp. ANG21]|uniref:Crp/Fnr family transcriptional regulator n=1 Tax=Allomuricauda sp. ANG21 TaxID=3042468 RepID=UPI0034549BF1
MEQIKAYFESNFQMSEADWTIFSSKLNRCNCSKKEILLEVGKTEKYLSFIENGIVRLYVPKEDGELTFAFVFQGGFVSAYDSFLTQSPSTYVVETVTDTVLWRLTYQDLQTVYKETDIGNFIGRKASEELFLKKSQRELSLLQDSAEERYLKLFTERPEIIQQIPLKYVASYIGITPQALSRIRSRIS